MNPEISIVIPAYNAANYIAATITSVIQQSFTNWEIIVVNDGSTDNTVHIVENFLSDSRIHLISQPNSGVSAARNAGIRLSKGKFIAFLDADDEFLPENLSLKYNILHSQPLADFVYSDAFYCTKNMENEFCATACKPEELFSHALLWEKEVIPAFSSNIMVKTSIMNGDLMFDENLSNCADRFMKIMLGKKARGIYVQQPLIKYRNTTGSMSKNISLLDKDENYIARIIKEKDIVSDPILRYRAISNIYLTLSGSWFRYGNNLWLAWKYSLKAIITYPPVVIHLLVKSVVLFIKKKPT